MRFKAPRALPPWRGNRDAFDFGSASLQACAALKTSEDCLYLNVWAPNRPGPHPVYVFIHGGGNLEGATATPVLDGENLARKGMVVVTIGYRVGALGFLELGALLGDAYAGSGNNGLRDQAMALAWVRNNIAAFGGDPDRITLGGQSAGAKDVMALIAMPETRGLFHRAICASGGGHTYAGLDMAPHAVHGSDLALVFDNLDQPVAAASGPVAPEARELGRVMNGYWTSFIESGRPAMQGVPAWTPYGPGSRATMVFDRESRIAADSNSVERQLWADWEPCVSRQPTST